MLATLVDWVGTGLLLAAGPVFLLLVVGLSPAEVGIGLTVAAVGGTALSVPLAAISDRYGGERVLSGLYVLRSGGFVAYALLVHDVGSFIAVTTLLFAADRADDPVTQALVLRLEREISPLELLAVLRTTINVGISVGGLVAAAVLLSPTAFMFDLLLVANAVTFLVAAVLVWDLPVAGGTAEVATDMVRVPFERTSPPPTVLVVFLSLATGVLDLWRVVLNLGIALWITQATTVSVSVVGLLYLVNTVLAVMGQVWVSGFVRSLAAAAWLEAVAGLSLASMCALLALAGAVDSETAAIGCLIGAVVLLTAGELAHTAASWKVSYAVTDPGRRGRGLATYGIGTAGVELTGPALVSVAIVASGTAGWLGMGIAFAITGVATSIGVRAIGHPRTLRESAV